MYVTPICTFSCFCVLVFVKFLLSSKDTFFSCYLIFLTATDSQATLHLALGLVGLHSAAASIWTVTKFSYLSFEVCLSDVP